MKVAHVFAVLEKTSIWGPAATFRTIHDEVLAKPMEAQLQEAKQRILDALDECSLSKHPVVIAQRKRSKKAKRKAALIACSDDMPRVVLLRFLGKR